VRAKRYALFYYIPIAKLLLGLSESGLLFSSTWKEAGIRVVSWWVIFARGYRAKLGVNLVTDFQA
jgi:hypothetical protein